MTGSGSCDASPSWICYIVLLLLLQVLLTIPSRGKDRSQTAVRCVGIPEGIRSAFALLQQQSFSTVGVGFNMYGLSCMHVNQWSWTLCPEWSSMFCNCFPWSPFESHGGRGSLLTSGRPLRASSQHGPCHCQGIEERQPALRGQQPLSYLGQHDVMLSLSPAIGRCLLLHIGTGLAAIGDKPWLLWLMCPERPAVCSNWSPSQFTPRFTGD